MIRMYFLAIAAICLSGSCLAAGNVVSFFVASDGTLATVVKGGKGYELVLRKNKRSVQSSLERINAVVDLQPNPKVSISSDSELIAIEFQDDETTGMVSFFDSKSLKEIRTVPATSFVWSAKSTYGYLVPPYDFDSGQKKDGLIRLAVITGVEEMIARGNFFTGEMAVKGDWIAARSAKHDGRFTRHCLLTIYAPEELVSESKCE